jgi:hypothetical protein
LIEYIERLPVGDTYARIIKDDQGEDFETFASDD